MEKKRAHPEYVASPCGAYRFLSGRTPGPYRLRIQAADTVRTGKHSKRSVLGTAVVEMDACGEHTIENPNRRLHMAHALFFRPRREARGGTPLIDRDGHILVPRDFPIRLGGLVE